jgi:hypothetical protein
MLNPAEEGGHPRACEAQGGCSADKTGGAEVFQKFNVGGLDFYLGSI